MNKNLFHHIIGDLCKQIILLWQMLPQKLIPAQNIYDISLLVVE